MSDLLLILIAGIGAGMINAVVGSGTLITFPTLLALGYPPITANISNNLGLIPGAISGTLGYRRELQGQRERAIRLAPMSFIGAIIGAVALLALPAEAFSAIVPVLIAIALVLVVVQPRLQAYLRAKREDTNQTTVTGSQSIGLAVGVLLTGIYGGYFGAAQGIILIAVIASILPETLQRANALKNLLSVIVNGVAGAVFLLIAADQVDWRVVALIALGSTIGGWLGSRYGRLLPNWALRAIIVAVGSIAIIRLLFFP